MIQFHSNINELVEFLNLVSFELDLRIVIMSFNPFNLKEKENLITLDDLDGLSMIRIVLFKDRMNLNAKSPNEFYELNSGTINLDVGKKNLNGLEESALGFKSEDNEKIVIANRVASMLKKITKSGVIAVNPETADESIVKSHRYTKGAKEMYIEGVKLLTIGGFINLKPIE